ncbi:MAG: helix-turn-helix domain-containing protein [Nitrososphaeria archaeon]|nr:helix-turn-helix domain-containing protein [Nitrososphaeria archaeon]
MINPNVNKIVNADINKTVNAFMTSVKFAYEELGLSYGYIAKLLNVTPTAVYYWVKGLRKPRQSIVKKCFMVLLDLIEANTYRLPESSDFSLNHMGPPENHFSFKTEVLKG